MKPMNYVGVLSDEQQSIILENNKNLARYMGYIYFPAGEGCDPGWKVSEDVSAKDDTGAYFLCRSHNELKYHYDWNWLMQIIFELHRRHEFIVTWVMNNSFVWHVEDFKSLKSNAWGKPKYFHFSTSVSVPEDVIVAVWDCVSVTVKHILENMDPKIPIFQKISGTKD